MWKQLLDLVNKKRGSLPHSWGRWIAHRLSEGDKSLSTNWCREKQEILNRRLNCLHLWYNGYMINEVALSYLAGFFDGEGSVFIVRRPNINGSISYALESQFTSSDLEPLEFAHSILGGSISGYGTKVKATYKHVYRLRFRSNQALHMLETLMPYLITKKKRAEIAVEYQTRKRGGQNRRRITEEECLIYRDKLSSMNDKVANRKFTIL